MIGAGPAGLSAALAAAGRGYDVEIFEKEAVPGGQVRSASRPPHKEAYLDWVVWAVRQLDRQGVKIHYGQEVTAERLKEGKPDAVILAAGADPVTPAIPGIDAPHVCRRPRPSRWERPNPRVPPWSSAPGTSAWRRRISSSPGDIEVTLVEMLPSSPVGKHTAHGYWLHKRIKEAGGRIILGATVTRIEPDAVGLPSGRRGETLPAALVVTAMGAKPENGLEGALQKLVIP